ncbi:putative T7SS-secreted protein [Streptomyces milbemycinicus]|uniref:T7SS-secreted protein n=1 Tax=Streptomyces milbemycinicus TaxID=476552 RepID=A0ABW8LKP5_9ACTN
MGWDLTPDWLDDAVESGTEAVGDGVEWLGNKSAEGLDKVGWEGGADWVRDKSRSAANALGADVAEMQLDETEDPKKLIFGSAGKLRSTATHLRDFQKAFDQVGNGLKGLDASHLKGKSADAFRDKVSIEPKKWFKAADACEKAAVALEGFAGTVEWAQGQAQEAIDAYKAAKKASQEARSAYNGKVETYNAAVDTYKAAVKDGKDPGAKPKKPGDFADPGPAKAKAAQERLDEARRQRNKAEETAVKAVAQARDAAPPKPSYAEQAASGLQGMALDLDHFAGGVVKGTAGLVNFARGLNPLDPYNITHPAEYVTNLNSTAAGLVTMANDPVGAGKNMLDAFAKDPSEGLGRLVPELVGTKGLGVARAGMGAAREGMTAARYARGGEDAARAALRKEGSHPFARKDAGKTCNGTDPVDLATGKMFLPQTDIALPGELPLVFRRRVESGYAAGGWFGPSWSSTADQRLEIDAEGVVFVSEDGLLLSYPHPAPGLPTLPAAGPRWPLERDAHGEYTLTDFATGRVCHFTGPEGGGDGVARLAQVMDGSGHFITFNHDGEGAPTDIVHSAGYHLKLTTTGGRITALHLAGAAEGGSDQEIVRYGYTDGNLTEVINSSGLPLRFAYDDERRVISWTDTNDRRYDYVYDNRDRCIAEGGEAGHISVRIDYHDADPATGHRITTVTTPDSHTSRYVINDACQVIAQTDPLGHTTRTTYDRHHRPLTHTDPLGHTTTHTYDQAGHLTTLTRPDGLETHTTYNAQGLPVTITGPDGTTWHQTWDEAGHRTSLTDPAGHTTTYAYDDHGHLIATTDALGHTTGVMCDPAGLPVAITDPLGATTRYQRDSFGRPTTITDPLGHTTHLKWTVEGNLTARTYPDGTTESWTYDGEGNCTSHTGPTGATTTYEYTQFDLLASRTDPDGVRYEFTHDTALRLTQVTNPQGLTWSYEYDVAGRMVSETDFDGRTLTYTHDTAGLLTARTNPLGQTLAFERDALGRTLRKTTDGQTTTFTYDPAGRLTTATGPDTEVVYQRDRMGRVKSEMVNGRILTHAYDALGRRTRRTTPTGATTTYTYDAAGNRTTLTTSGHTLDFDHDATGRETTRHLDDTLTFTHTWDPLGRLTEQTLTGPAATDPVHHRAYTYRADGHLTAIDDQHAGLRTFDLDAAGRVTTVHARRWTESYAYDEAGNQTHASWPERHPGTDTIGTRAYTGTRITRAGDLRYEHDDAGRLTLRQKTRLSRKPDTWHYTWDTEDHLTTVTTPDGTLWRYLYDPFGRRTTKQRLAADGRTVAEQTDFTWDGPTLVEQTTTTTGLPRPVTLTWEHEGLQPIAQTERITDTTTQREVDQRFFAIVTDLVGTPTHLIDETGDIAWNTRTTLWGTTTWTADSTTYTPLRFPGQYYDPETGLHYNHHRYYDPTTARYLTPDPLGLTPAPNPTTYVHNPTTWSDPHGLAPCKPSLRDRLRSLFSRDPVSPQPPAARPPLMLESPNPGIETVSELFGPFHRRGSPTQTPEVTQQVLESGELWGREARWGGEEMVQAHRGPIPDNHGPGSFEFYTSVEPKPANRTPPGYVAWELGSEPGVGRVHHNGEDFARIPVFVTEVR